MKYVIDFEDTPTWEEGLKYHRCKQAPWWSASDNIINRLEPYDQESAYNKGLDDAWKAAKRIVCEVDDGGLSKKELRLIFNKGSLQAVIRETTASEAIKRLNEYEARKAYKVGSVISDPKTGEKYLIFRITDTSYDCLSGSDFEPVGIGKDYIHQYTYMNDDKDMDALINGISGREAL